ncbi:DUF6153 family protein [Rhodococcus kroppenstedtii]|uniref:DUF6153 family protein n=1 Tax=Rhodococcoides kroppenstedtii TaxID=293050 RepID=UPI002952FE9E|nr:DUF6153 family protein [Rhodococcus kroppenstedtii]MDV7199628.1 DUF6153 family protein [Rhodococcus kroppenstedtii]
MWSAPLSSLSLIFGVVVGVLLMHTLPVSSSSHEQIAAAESTEVAAAAAADVHQSVHLGAAVDEVVPLGKATSCPSGHQMLHPCMGTVVSWPPMSPSTGLVAPLPSTDAMSGWVMTVMGLAGRAPPWAVSSLDESVLLRV